MYEIDVYRSNSNWSCKDCKERHAGCHSKCEKYLKMKQLREETEKNRRRIEKENGVITAKRTRNRNATFKSRRG